jgi:tRNA pseudouridine55 synthase
MDGLSVIDKPAGPTSHDVVRRMRRVLGERRIGHAGTLDPGATGVLVLLVGRATRLAQFLSSSDKTYEAVLRLGQRTDSGDADGTPVGGFYQGPMPARQDIERALNEFRGTFLQRPPAFSAKHVAGTRSHHLARSARRTGTALADESRPDPVSVTAHRIDVLHAEDDEVTLRLDCSAGFYVRSLAQDLGERLGTGGHVKSLRRTRSGAFGLGQALSLETAEREPAQAAASLLPMAEALPELPAITLSPEGVRRVRHGRDVGPAEFASVRDDATPGREIPGAGISGGTRRGLPGPDGGGRIVRPATRMRLIDVEGILVAIGEPAGTSGLLHPLIVLM